MKTPLLIKASVLSEGIALTTELLSQYGPSFIEKRRAYGNQDPSDLRNVRIPQEIYVDPSGQKLIAAVNVNPQSNWILNYEEGTYLLIDSRTKNSYDVTFPHRPNFYDFKLPSGENVSQVITLYGGCSLGLFAYGRCHLVDIEKPCQYCSISQNWGKGTDFVKLIKKEQVYDAVRLVLQDDSSPATQIMLNGGNFKEMDKSFLHYVSLVKSINAAVQDSRRVIPIHMIVYPPADLGLLNELDGLDIGIAINTEVFNPELFERYCPGKAASGGQAHLFGALRKAVEVLGEGRVFSILVGGLEPISSLREGLQFLAGNGIFPIVNVLHTDPETPLEHFPNPSVDAILAMGHELQEVFTRHSMTPFYNNCGRNSIDTEAFRKLFN